MFLASKQEKTELPDFGEFRTGFREHHGIQIPEFRIKNYFSLGEGLPALPKDLCFLPLQLQFGNATCGSVMVPPTVTGFCPQLLKHFVKMHEASQQTWRQASTTVHISALSLLPSACSDRAEQHLLLCSSAL